MIESANVRLRRSSEAPLRIIKERYGGPEGLEPALEGYVLAAERRARRMESLPPTKDPETQQLLTTVAALLDVIAAYGALGTMGHADQRVCELLLPLLTRFTKAALLGGFALEETEDAEEALHTESSSSPALDAEVLVEKAAKAISNCTRGVTCREADCVFEATLCRDSVVQATITTTGAAGPAPDVLSVCFGFADYSESETGAMLWAGAVGLSLFLIERGQSYLWPSTGTAAGDGTRRIIEIGCGPGLVSLVVADLYRRRVAMDTPAEQAPSSLRLDITDISPGVVREVHQSFATRNAFAHCEQLRFHLEGGEEGDGEDRAAPLEAMTAPHKPTLTVRPFCFDFSSIQDEAMKGQYDVVLASDVVYDFRIAQYVAPAIEGLLRPGGTAILCCEAHRDGMQFFVRHIREHTATSLLEVVQDVADVRALLTWLELPNGLTTTTCSVIILRRKPNPALSFTE